MSWFRRSRAPDPPLWETTKTTVTTRYVTMGTPVLDWDYDPAPPFTVEWMHERLDPDRLHIEYFDALTSAIADFFDFGLPARPKWTGVILDATDRRALVWSLDSHFTHPSAPWGSTGYWAGIRRSFEAMDQLDIATPAERKAWEARAFGSRW